MRYLSSSESGADAACDAMGWPLLEDRVLDGTPIASSAVPPWPLLHAARGQSVPSLLIMMFCCDGDNLGEAVEMANRCDDLLAHALSRLRSALPAASAWPQPARAKPDELPRPRGRGRTWRRGKAAGLGALDNAFHMGNPSIWKAFIRGGRHVLTAVGVQKGLNVGSISDALLATIYTLTKNQPVAGGRPSYSSAQALCRFFAEIRLLLSCFSRRAADSASSASFAAPVLRPVSSEIPSALPMRRRATTAVDFGRIFGGRISLVDID